MPMSCVGMWPWSANPSRAGGWLKNKRRMAGVGGHRNRRRKRATAHRLIPTTSSGTDVLAFYVTTGAVTDPASLVYVAGHGLFFGVNADHMRFLSALGGNGGRNAAMILSLR